MHVVEKLERKQRWHDRLQLAQMISVILPFGWLVIALGGMFCRLWTVNTESLLTLAQSDPTGYYSVAHWFFYLFISENSDIIARFTIGFLSLIWGILAGVVLSPLITLIVKIRWHAQHREWPWWPYFL